MIKWLRRVWCSRNHDLGYRLHDWTIVNDVDLLCRRCGVVREGMHDPIYAKGLQESLDRLRESQLRNGRA